MTNFEKFGLNSNLLQAIEEMGFVDPTPIQEETIPSIIENSNDVIALAQTGTGKTAAFGLPIIQLLDAESKNIQAIILSPTRELCIQISKDIKTYTKYMDDIKVLAVYGGASIENQLRDLKRGVHIVVGTPGRTLDLIKRKSLNITKIKWLVLDEADEMLNMGFKDELDGILEKTPDNKQTLLFSATMPKEVRRIANNYMNDPAEISVGKKNTGADNVSHQYYVVRASDRYAALKRIADYNYNIYGIIFCRTRRETKDIAAKLINDGYNADALHGDLSQSQREQVMDRFRKHHLQLLVATDVAARGLDINDLTHVINYNLPDDPEVYIHRSGRTGRAGKNGISIIISHSREGRKIKDVEKAIGKPFEQNLLPSGKEICEKRLYNLMDKIENIEVDEEQIAPFLPAILKKLSWLDFEELLKRFVSVEFNRFLEYYKGASDLNVKQEAKREFKGSQRSAKGYTRFFINIGKKQSLKATGLIGLINDQTHTKDIEIGKIELLRNFSFFEVDKAYENDVLQGFADAEYKGIQIAIEVAKADKKGSDNDRPERGGGRGKRSNSGGRNSFRDRKSNRKDGDRNKKSGRGKKFR